MITGNTDVIDHNDWLNYWMTSGTSNGDVLSLADAARLENSSSSAKEGNKNKLYPLALFALEVNRNFSRTNVTQEWLQWRQRVNDRSDRAALGGSDSLQSVANEVSHSTDIGGNEVEPSSKVVESVFFCTFFAVQKSSLLSTFVSPLNKQPVTSRVDCVESISLNPIEVDSDKPSIDPIDKEQINAISSSPTLRSSKRRLWTEKQLLDAIASVLSNQGEPLP